MKSLITFSVIILIVKFNALAQTQINVIKKPAWNIKTSYDSKYGSKLDIAGNALAMIVDVPKADFAVVIVDDKLNQKSITPLSGFPMAIGKFKNSILVVASSDRSFLTSFENKFIGYLLDETTGKLIMQKIIYEGKKDYFEQPDFFFSEDGSYFKMSVRLTNMKRTIHFGSTAKEFKSSQSYTIIEYNSNLEQAQKMEPQMPAGDTWNASCAKDGTFIISTFDTENRKINIATYLSSNPKPLKVVSMPIDLYKDKDDEVSSITCASSKTPLINYVALFYRNSNKEFSSYIARVDFNTGTYILAKEIFDNDHIKALRKSFVPVNKKIDDIEFKNPKYMNIRHLEEYNDKLLVSIASKYTMSSQYQTITFDGSVLMNIYDQALKPLYYQFIPRNYKSQLSEGSKVSYNLKDNVLRILANQQDGLLSVSTIYTEMDLNSGKINKMNFIPKNDIKSSYYANTEAVSWLNESFITPFVERAGSFSKRVDIQILQMKY